MSTPASTAAGRRRTAARAPSGTRAAPRPKAATPATPKRKVPRKPARRLPALPAIGSIGLPRLHLGGLRSFTTRRGVLVTVLLAAALAAGYYGWFRNSSFVAVQEVKVDGVTTPGGDQIVGALTDAAQGMSSLNVDEARLSAVAAGFPTVASVSADGNFPHGLTIHVTERPPAMIASDGHGEVPVAADGTILTGLDLGKAADGLPVLDVTTLKEAGRLGGDPLRKALVLGAAPAPLRPLIDGIGVDPDIGITVTLHGGFKLEFGSSEKAAEKWAAAAAVLADPKLDSLTYLDVRNPGRPAVG